MIIFVLDDGETWTLSEPTAVSITTEQLTRLEDGEKFYHVVPDWAEQPEPSCNCVRCTTARTASRKIVEAQNEAMGTVDQVIAEKREMDARMFLSDLERGER